MAPVDTDSLLTDWRMTGVVVIARVDGGSEYACSTALYIFFFFLNK